MTDERLVVSVLQARLTKGGDNNRSHLIDLVERALTRSQPDVMVLPNHLGRRGPQPLSNALIESLADLARDHSMAIIGALAERAEDGYFNSAFIIGSDGRPMGVQRKFMLSPVESATLRPGSAFRIFDTHAVRFCVVLGEDILFPDFCRIAALSGAEVVFTPSLIVGEVVHSLRNACCARAFENRLFVVNANGIPADLAGTRTPRGNSTIASPFVGKNIIQRAGTREMAISATLDIARYRAERDRDPREPVRRRGRPRKYRLGPDPRSSLELLQDLGIELEVEIRSVKGGEEE